MIRSIYSLLLLILSLSLLLGTYDARAEKRVALVIGNAAYTGIASLKKPLNDARKVAEMLRDMKFEVILGVDATKQELDRLAKSFDDALNASDVGFFYFSGHGFQTAQAAQQHPVNHVVPIDFTVDSVGTNLATLPLDRVIDSLRRKARLGYVFMDACRSDPRLTAASERHAGNTRAVAISRGFSPVSIGSPGGSPARPAAGKGPMGLLIAYATDPGNVALEGDKGQFSPFTSALVKHLPAPGSSIAEVMGRVSAEVAAETSGQQTPWNVASLTAGAYQFVPRPSGQSSQPASRPGNSSAGRPAGAGAPARSNLPPNLGVGVGAGL